MRHQNKNNKTMVNGINVHKIAIIINHFNCSNTFLSKEFGSLIQFI